MHHIEFFVKGLLIGILVSVPMGPIGVLCVQKTVNRGRVVGFLSGLGAATADTLYASLTAFGVSYITSFLTNNQLIFQIVGIATLLFLGFRMFFNNPIKQYRYYRTSSHKHNALKDYISVFFITISNPLTIIFFGATFTMMGILADEQAIDSNYMLVSGVFVGASFWWFLLTSFVNIFRKRFRLRNIFILNRVSGALIIGLSLVAILKFFVF